MTNHPNRNRNYDCPHVDQRWAESRETCMAVATAIHAISDSRRPPEAIWDSPSKAEEDHVKMAVQEYVTHGDFEPADNGPYEWGASAITI